MGVCLGQSAGAQAQPVAYPYDAAFMSATIWRTHHDMISRIEASAQVEVHQWGQGRLLFLHRHAAGGDDQSPALIAGLRRAVTNYGATIGPHNGGLQEPQQPVLGARRIRLLALGAGRGAGCDPCGLRQRQAYATAQFAIRFRTLRGGCRASPTACAPGWAVLQRHARGLLRHRGQLGVKTSGDQKLGPFPHWVLSTSLGTPGKRYPFISLPVSDWYVGSDIAQSIEAGHTLASVQAAVDFYYNLGALINLYSHSSSAGGGAAGALEAEYISYSMTKPRLWPANAASVYSWWLARSNARILPRYSTNGAEAVTTLSITGATDPRMAVEIVIPQTSYDGLQVFTNGVAASADSYRTNGQVVKLLVGTSVTNAVIRYFLLLSRRAWLIALPRALR